MMITMVIRTIITEASIGLQRIFREIYFDQDMLYSFGAFMTVCKITRNDAENRIKAMEANNWKVPGVSNSVFSEADDTQADSSTNLEEAIQDAIAKHIIHKFKGYKMEILIEEILKAKGFTVYHSKQGLTEEKICWLPVEKWDSGHLRFVCR